LFVAAVLTAVLYGVVLVLPYPLLSSYDIPLLDLGKLANYGALHALVLVGGFALIFRCYVEGYRAAGQLTGRSALIVIVGAGTIFCVILLWAYPVGAADIYDYVFRARLWGLYDYNPLTVTPLQVNDDPWFPYVVWIWFPSPYGPLWAYISVALYRIAGHGLLTNLLMFKLLPIACIVLTSLLLFDLLRRRTAGEALGGVLLFAWNPLLLFEAAVNGHNDIIMLTLLVAALWFYRRQRLMAALLCGTLAALVKVAALLALPVLLLAGACRASRTGSASRKRVMGTGLALCALVAAMLYAPLWQGPQTLAGLLALDNRFTSSLAAVVKLALEEFAGREPAERLTRSVFALLFMGAYLALLRRAERKQQAVHETLFAAIACFLILGTLWFQPWYLTWLIALAPLAAESRRRLSVVWSASALSTYLLFDFAWYWFPDFFNAGNELVLNLIAVTLWLGPPVLTIAAQSMRAQRPAAKHGSMAP
jgi:alpha-1,6-mannosyltransferase